MTDLLIRNIPEDVLQRLKGRAALNKRSLQQELVSILEEAAAADMSRAAELAERIRDSLSEGNRSYGDSTVIIREDREK